MNLFQAQCALQQIEDKGFGRFEIRDSEGRRISRKPHSHRGNYTDLAFEPEYLETQFDCEEFRQVLGESANRMYETYKGGDKFISEKSELVIAFAGCTGQRVDRILVDLVEEQVILMLEPKEEAEPR